MELVISLNRLDNIAWYALTGPHARYASGANGARRYASGFSPIIGFADMDRPDFAALDPVCKPGERFYCGGWSGPAPAGWSVEVEAVMHKMVWEAPMPAADLSLGAVRLRTEHVPAMLELVDRTRPGPFGPRTVELGEYFGVFEGQRLVAMAGERMCASQFKEISGVCTHPQFQWRGLARRLVAHLIRRQMLRDETPFLHVLSDNHHARGIYERMGFCLYRETVMRVVSRNGTS